MARIGMTGTKRGLSAAQAAALESFLCGQASRGPCELHHGDCIGADEQGHALALRLGMRVVVHPPDDDSRRARCLGAAARPPLPYLDRNRAIVDAVELLVACPSGPNEKRRSGTWATVRYARKAGKPIALVLPDGSVRVETRPRGLP